MTAFQLLLIHSLFKDFALAKSNLRDKKIGHSGQFATLLALAGLLFGVTNGFAQL